MSDDNFVSPDDFHADEPEETTEETQEEEAEESEEVEASDSEGEGGEEEGDGEEEDKAAAKAKVTDKNAEDFLTDEQLDRKIKTKINGEERVMTVRQAIKLRQLEDASYEKMKSAAQREKFLAQKEQQLARMALENPEEFLRKTGRDPEQFAAELLRKRMQREEMTQEQREALEWKERAERERRERMTLEQRIKQQEEDRAVEEEYQKIQQEIQTAWEDSGLPMNEEFHSAIGQVMLRDHQQKQELRNMGIDAEPDLTAKQAAEIVKKNWQSSVQSVFGNLDAEAILNILGEDNFKKIRQHEIKRATAKASPKFAKSKKSAQSKTASTTKKRNRPLTDREYQEWLESL